MSDLNNLSAREQIASLVQGLLVKRAGFIELSTEQNLTDAGLTSLDMVNLMLSIEDVFGIEIPQKRMTPANFRSIAAIEQLVSAVALAA
jgi:acyl carrier protein